MKRAAKLLLGPASLAHSRSCRRCCSCCPPFLSSLHVVEGFPSAKSGSLSRIIKAHFRACDLIAENQNLCFKFTLFPPPFCFQAARGGRGRECGQAERVTARLRSGVPSSSLLLVKMQMYGNPVLCMPADGLLCIYCLCLRTC